MADGAHRWELSKENVQPMKRGRQLEQLDAVAGAASVELRRKRAEEGRCVRRGSARDGIAMPVASSSTPRQFLHTSIFEAQVRDYVGDDPLDVWIRCVCRRDLPVRCSRVVGCTRTFPRRYIKWAQVSFTSDGGSPLVSLLERCLRAFRSDPRYRDDMRFLRILILLVRWRASPGA